MVGCSQGESRVEEGNRLGILHIGAGTDIRSLDPHVATDSNSGLVIASLHEGLVTLNPYDLSIEPGLAESWEVSEDGKIYRFHIRDNAKWSDGTAVTIDDIYWTFQRYLNPKMGNPWAFMLFPVVNAEEYLKGNISNFSEVGFNVVDQNTFEIYLSEAAPYFMQLLAHQSSAVVSRKAIEEHGEVTSRFSQWTRAGNMISNGPFYLERWDVFQPLIVKKNPHYWGAEDVSLNGIIFYPIDDEKTEERMYRAGLLHKTYQLPESKIPFYQREAPEGLVVEPYLGTYFYSFNMHRDRFQDVRVRKALAMSIDRQAIIDNVLNGINEPAYAMTPPGTIGYYPPKTFEYNPERARELLAEAGYPNGEGFGEFELIYNTLDAHRKIAVAVQQMWKETLNIDVTLANQEWKVYLDTQDNFDFDITRASWIGDYVDPMTFLSLGMSTNGSNTAGFSDPEYDRLLQEYVPSASTSEERLERFYEAEAYLMERMPYIPIYTYMQRYLIHPSVEGLPANIRQEFNFRYVRLGEE